MYCSKECEDAYTSFFTLRAKLQKLLSALNILGTCLIAVGIFVVPMHNFLGLLMMGVGGLSVGGITLFLPTPTDNMIKKMKLKKAIEFVRIFAIVLLVFGAVTLTLGFFNM